MSNRLLDRPDLERAAERVLHDVFGEGEVVDPENPAQGRDHAPRFAAEEMLADVHQIMTRFISL